MGRGGGTLANVNNTPSAPNEAVQIGLTYGVLKLTLYPGSYGFRFEPVPGLTAADSGGGNCR